MANFISRNVLICVVPAFVLLLSVYWFRKKKKIKPDAASPAKENNLPVMKKNEAYDSGGSIYSPVESTSDFSNTFSDASSISSPENSLRTMSIFGETSSDNVADDGIEDLTISNHIDQLNYNIISIAKEEKMAADINNTENIQNEKSENSDLNAAVLSNYDKNELNDSRQLKENIINSLCNAVNTSSEESIEKCLSDNEKVEVVDKSDFSNGLDGIDTPNSKVEQEQTSSVSNVSVIEEVVEEPIIALKLSISEFTKPAEIKPLEDSVITAENDSQDSHSSVLDENSLSSVSDESERQADFKYKDSPSSVFDGNSISDASEKTDVSNDHNTINLKPDENCKDAVDYAHKAVESVDSQSNEQYSIKLNKNSFFVKALAMSTASEGSGSEEKISNSPSSSQCNSSALSASLQNFASDECVVSTSKDDFSTNNQSAQLNEEVDSSDNINCDSSVATSLLSEFVSLDSDNVISSTSSDKNCSLIEEQSESVVNSSGSDIVSLSNEFSPKDTVKVNGSGQIDSLSLVDTDNSSGTVKSSEDQLEESHKVSELEMVDIKSSGGVPGLFVYEFELPQELCGRLIGRQGKHVKSIKERTNANVFIKRHPFDNNLKTVVVEGSRSSVHEALDIIRRKFPPSQFPTVTLIQTNILSSHGVSLPESLQLHLPEGASCDVILSSLVSAGHFFLQQPTHPTYPSLGTLDQCMINCYTQMDTPMLPQPVEAGVICAAPVMNGWFRAQIIYVYENRPECEIKFVDYGGFSQVPFSSLRQIRSDFMTLPFQASECYLANVRPVDRNAGWSSEATSVFEELAQGQILTALLVEYAEDGIPCVHLYRVQGVSNMFINRELVERGLAVWVDNGHWDPH